VLEMNYIGGHLPGYHFTPTLRHLPRNLFAFRPNTGHPGSPNEMINRLGYYVVMASRHNNVRALYDASGAYVTHGQYDEIHTALNQIIAGV